MKIVDLEDKKTTMNIQLIHLSWFVVVVVILIYLVKEKGQGKNLYLE